MAYIGKEPNQKAVRNRFYYTATGGETSLSSTQITNFAFEDGAYVDVSLNGIALVAGTDYNTTTANTIGGLSALTASDVVEVLVYEPFSVFSGNVNGDFNVNGSLKLSDTAITATAAELNYVDGVTSNIQTQIDNIASDLVDDTTPQLGGVLDTNGNNIEFPDSTGAEVNRLKFGTGDDLQMYFDGTNSVVSSENSTDMYLQANNIYLRSSVPGAENGIRIHGDGSVEAYYDNSKKLETASHGATVYGGLVSSGSATTTSFNANGTSTAAGSYNYILSGANDGGNRAVMFVNGTTRTADGGANALTLRNDGGKLVLGSASYPIELKGSWASAPAGTIIQVVTAQSSTAVTVNSTTYTSIISASITPRNADSRFLLIYSGNRDNTSGNTAFNWFSFYRDGTAVGVISLDQSQGGGLGYNSQVAHQIVDDNPNTTSAITYSFRAKQGSGTTVWGESSSGNSLTIMEIAG